MEKHSADIPAKFKPAPWQNDVFFFQMEMVTYLVANLRRNLEKDP